MNGKYRKPNPALYEGLGSYAESEALWLAQAEFAHDTAHLPATVQGLLRNDGMVANAIGRTLARTYDCSMDKATRMADNSNNVVGAIGIISMVGLALMTNQE